jgi:hypothetical protein
MATCPDCGKQFPDDGLHLCAAGNRHTGTAPATKLEIRGPDPNDDADATGGLTFTRKESPIIPPPS